MSDLFERTLVRAEATLREAMRSLEESGLQIALVVTPSRRLEGTITDGDIRRALLAGSSLDAPLDGHINTECFTVSVGAARADVLELMAARHIAQIPEVDEDRVVHGLHLLHEMISPVERPNAAVIMAGGRGARLSPLTERVPKPMLHVAGRPILERIVLHLVGSGIRQIYLSVNYLGELIESHFGDGHRYGAAIDYLREPDALGPAGSVSLLREVGIDLRDPFLVMNGDLVTQVNVGRMLDFHTSGDQAVTMAVRRHFEQLPFGSVEVDGDELVGFVEKPTTSRLINAGIYVADPECVSLVGDREALSMPDLVDRVRARGQVARIFEIDEDWIDVGRPSELERARRGE
jgi:dTDP-glucose pyrophosphorylase